MSGETSRLRGRSRELKVRDFYRSLGYVSWRIAFGTADVIALKAGEPPALVQVKSTTFPYEHFRPLDRDALLRDAEAAGGVAVLAHWPKGGALTLIPSTAWPPSNVEAVA